MQIELSEEHQAIQENVAKICAGFDDAYWSAREEEKTFPFEFHRAMADGGWLASLAASWGSWASPSISMDG